MSESHASSDSSPNAQLLANDFRRLDACVPPQGPLPSLVDWSTRTTRAPAPFHLASALPLFAYVVTRKGFTYGTRMHPKPFRLHSMIVASSGVGKSTAADNMIEFFREWNMRMGGYLGDPVINATGTWPGVLELISQRYDPQSGTTAVVLRSDEASHTLQQEGITEGLNEMHNARDYQRNIRRYQEAKKTDDTVQTVIKRPALSGIWTTTPASLEATVTRAHIEGGMLGRMMLVYDHFRKKADFISMPLREPHTEVREWVFGIFDQWLAHLNVLKTRRQTHVWMSLHLATYLANRLEDRFWEDVHAQTAIAGILTRLREHVEALAALYALNRGSVEVNIDDVNQALSWVHAFVEPSTRHILGQLTTHTMSRDAYQVHTRILDAGAAGISKRKLYHQTRMPKAFLDQALEQLIDSESIVYVKVQPPGGGRPAMRYFAVDHTV